MTTSQFPIPNLSYYDLEYARIRHPQLTPNVLVSVSRNVQVNKEFQFLRVLPNSIVMSVALNHG